MTRTKVAVPKILPPGASMPESVPERNHTRASRIDWIDLTDKAVVLVRDGRRSVTREDFIQEFAIKRTTAYELIVRLIKMNILGPRDGVAFPVISAAPAENMAVKKMSRVSNRDVDHAGNKTTECIAHVDELRSFFGADSRWGVILTDVRRELELLRDLRGTLISERSVR